MQPKNPYNCLPIKPDEFYIILYYASLNNINIPASVNLFAKDVNNVKNAYSVQLSITDSDAIDTYMRNVMILSNLKYVGGDPLNGIAGNWTYNNNDNRYIYEYMNGTLTPLLIMILFIGLKLN